MRGYSQRNTVDRGHGQPFTLGGFPAGSVGRALPLPLPVPLPLPEVLASDMSESDEISTAGSLMAAAIATAALRVSRRGPFVWVVARSEEEGRRERFV